MPQRETRMISIDNLSKSFGGQELFQKVSLKLNAKERVGLVGRNGHGKTTLFRLITGEETPDEGTLTYPKHYRVGYVRQTIAFTRETALEEGMTGLTAAEKDHHWKVEKVLAGLGFSEADLRRRPLEFSGGYQVRLNLAKVLVSDPDLLLLDEPTNYLDITSIRWITQFLSAWPRELLLITHDRGFMDKVVTHILGIHRKKIRKIAGTTEKYYAQMAMDEEVYEKTRVNDEKRRKEIEVFISRFRAKARLANLVQSRVKTLSKMEKQDKLESIRTLDFSFAHQPFPGKRLMTAAGLGFAYEDANDVIRDFELIVNPGDRICVVGPNGRGKTTLLKLLAGVLIPGRGSVNYHPEAVRGYFEQTNIKSLVDNHTVEEEILYAHPGVDRQKARNICGAMMFPGDAALKKIAVLSGGEKSRVMLGKLLATPLNLLLLDEPTNHLDMESCDALLAAIDNFEGALIMVTHNELFLHGLARRLIVFQAGAVEVFDGSYAYFLEKRGWQGEKAPAAPLPETAAAPTEKPGLSKKELRRSRSEIISRRASAVAPLKKEIVRIETRIEHREKILAVLNEDMQAAAQQQAGRKIAELSRAIHSAQTELDKLYEMLEDCTLRLEEKERAFEARLSALG
jgi:ATP-binding cassette subfamily F protein 3